MEVKYSLDKIKLLLNVKLEQANIISSTLAVDVRVKSNYLSNKVTNCAYNYILLNDNNDSYYMGISANWVKRFPGEETVLLEYNPNKVDFNNIPCSDILKWALKRNLFKIMSFDLTADLDLVYSQVFMQKRDIREYFCNIGNTSIETRYLGTTKKTGHVKLYNKALEQKVEGDWTRFEITVKNISSIVNFDEFNSSVNLPPLYYLNRQLKFTNLKDVQYLVVLSILDDPDRLYLLKDRKTRNKYLEIIKSISVPVNLSKREFYKVFVKYFDRITL